MGLGHGLGSGGPTFLAWWQFLLERMDWASHGASDDDRGGADGRETMRVWSVGQFAFVLHQRHPHTHQPCRPLL
jgi:hypothetical protein